MAARYKRLADELPSYPGFQALAADGMVAAGKYEMGIEYADRALDLESPGRPNARAWWARGVGFERLGQIDTAFESFETAIAREPQSIYSAQAHRGLARILAAHGDLGGAQEHREQADELEGS